MTATPDTPEWLALRRVQRGGITRIGGSYLDRGSAVADYLGIALDQLTGIGLVLFGEPEPTGRQRAALTPAGHARLADLNTRRRGGPEPSWVVSSIDHHSHALDEGLTLARCGQYLPGAVAVNPSSEIPMCVLCRAVVFGT